MLFSMFNPYGSMAIFLCTAYNAALWCLKVASMTAKSFRCDSWVRRRVRRQVVHATLQTAPSEFRRSSLDAVVPCCSTGSAGGAMLLRFDQPTEDMRHQDRGVTVLYPRTAGLQPDVGHRRAHLHVLLPRLRWVPTVIQLWCLFRNDLAIY